MMQISPSSPPRLRPRASALMVFISFITATAAVLLPKTALAAPADTPPPSSPLEQVQALVQPTVVYEQITWTGYVYDETNDGYFTQDPFTTSFQCTGFVVNPDGYVATAGHCVDYDQTVQDAILSQVVQWAFDNEYYAAKPSKSTIATFARNWRIDGASTEGRPDLDVSVAYGVSVSGEPSGKALPARVVNVRPVGQGDVALLKIEARDLTVASLSDNATTGVGTEVVAIGYPASVDLVTDVDFNPSFKEGTISAEKTTDAGLLQVFEISAAVSGGMSGGPTVGLDGDVIGVNSFKISGETQPFNFVQPSQTLEELMRSEGVENTLGAVTEKYRAGLQAYFAGDGKAATADFEEVLQMVPSHQFAQEYLRKAQDLPGSSSFPFLWVALAVAVLVLIIVVIVVVARTRRGPAPATGSIAAAPATGEAPQAPPNHAEPAEPEVVAAHAEPAEPEVVAAHAEPAEPEVVAAPGEPRTTSGEDLFCSQCGRPHGPDDRFCPRCGHQLQP